jgi:hypothetical protein
VGNLFCQVRSGILSELTEKSAEVADAANHLAIVAAKDGAATLQEKVDFVNLRSRLRALIQECEVLHDRMQRHRDEHGC